MPLNIKKPEADQLARALARLKRMSITDAVIESLRDSLARENARMGTRSLKEVLREIGRRCAALPDLDTRSAEETIGYDQTGAPR